MLEPDLPHPSSASSLRWSAHQERHTSFLRRALDALILCSPHLERMPDEVEVHHLLNGVGLDGSDYAAACVRIERRRFTILCPLKSSWTENKRAFFEAKAAAAALGHAVVLVPQSFVCRQPRLNNSLMIADAAEAPIRLTDRMSLLAFLMENGGSAPLSDLAGLVKGPDPVSAIMRLIVEGGLFMDLERPILPTNEVFLVQP